MTALVSCRSSALAGSHALIVPWAQPERTSARRAHGKPSTKGRAVGGRLGAGSWELGASAVSRNRPTTQRRNLGGGSACQLCIHAFDLVVHSIQAGGMHVPGGRCLAISSWRDWPSSAAQRRAAMLAPRRRPRRWLRALVD